VRSVKEVEKEEGLMPKKIPFYRGAVPASLIKKLEGISEKGLPQTVQKFEERFCEMVGCRYSLSTCNSTAALHLAMCALDLKRGDKVICSVNSFVDIPEVVRHFDAEPIFVDCDPETYNMHPEKLNDALRKHKTKKLRAVIVNHMAGLPADMDQLLDIAKEHGVEVVEDATDALGARYKEKRVGELESDITVFGLGSKIENSFDAGVFTSSRADYYERARLLRNHALVQHSESVDYLYDIMDIGCQYRMSEYDALYADSLLDEVEERIARRREIAEIYFKELQNLKHLSLPLRAPEHTYSSFIVEIDKNRDAFSRKLKEHGIGVALHYVPMHVSRYYKEKYGLKVFDFPNALGVYQRVMSLPNFPGMSDDEVLYVSRRIREIDKGHI
jgi:dTDP-4-amino-4,6-dideoxygalactose transaminase